MPKAKSVKSDASNKKDLTSRINSLYDSYNSLNRGTFTRSGSVVIDALLGGGIPQGVIILWSSESGCGKSTGSLHISKAYCRTGKKVAYFDYEGGVNEDQLIHTGLSEYLYDKNTNPEGLFYLFQLQTYKDAEKVIDEIMDDMDLVVFDSVTSMLPEKLKGVSSEDSLIGIDARIMSVFLKKYKANVVRSGCSWILINQLRTKIATGYGQHTADVEAGGHALKFYPDIRIIMKKAYQGTLEREEDTAVGKQKVPFGAICTIWTEKNRYARPKIPLNLAIIYGRGISNSFAYADFLMYKGAIKKTGSWFNIKFGDFNEKAQGINKVIDWIEEHRVEVREFINSNGGYKLLMNDGVAVDLGHGSMQSLGDGIVESGVNFDVSDGSVISSDVPGLTSGYSEDSSFEIGDNSAQYFGEGGEGLPEGNFYDNDDN